MKVFISWSGIASRDLAEALRWWLPKVIQGIDPFVSSKDIDKGANWTTVLQGQLETTTFGIVCLTPENLSSPWLNFEAGAISSAVDSRVCPVLLGLEKSDVSAPLSQLQITSLDQEDIFEMMSSLNKAANSPLTPEALKETVEIWWPKLEERIKKIGVPKGPDKAPREPAQPELTPDEMIEEVLRRVRRIDNRILHGDGMSSRRRDIESSRKNVRRLPPKNHLAVMAEDVGLKFKDAEVLDDAFLMEFEHLPEPVPNDFYNYASEIASRSRMLVRLYDPNGRLVEFDENGKPSEPPF